MRCAIPCYNCDCIQLEDVVQVVNGGMRHTGPVLEIDRTRQLYYIEIAGEVYPFPRRSVEEA